VKIDISGKTATLFLETLYQFYVFGANYQRNTATLSKFVSHSWKYKEEYYTGYYYCKECSLDIEIFFKQQRFYCNDYLIKGIIE
jgi:hypothetical protein